MNINVNNIYLVKEHVKRLLSIVDTYGHFMDSFIIEFFIEDHWSKVNPRWKSVFEDMEPSDFSRQIFETKPPSGYTTVLPLSLLAFKSCCSNLGISREYDASTDDGEFNMTRSQSKMIDHIFRKHVKPKKQHELRKLVNVILKEIKQCDVMRVVDVGSGHGHLSRFLAIGHEIPVSSFELNAQGVARAKQFDEECIKCAFKKIPSGPKVVPSHNICYIEPFISSHDFMKLFQNIEPNRLLLTGLHACGDLSATMIHTFANCEEVKVLVSISCCYMKLSTQQDSHSKNEVYGYPMSSFVNSLAKQHLSYKSRATACHANENFAARLLTNGDELRVHCCRSVLENLIRESCPKLVRPGVQISQKIQLSDFEKYVEIAFDKLKIPVPSPGRIRGENISHMHCQWRKVVIYYALSLLLAPLVETIVLLDRSIYLFENGFNSKVQCIFDPKLSPRCFALIANKDTS